MSKDPRTRTRPSSAFSAGLRLPLAMWEPFLWPAFAMAEAGRSATEFARQMVASATPDPLGKPWSWLTPHDLALELRTMRLLDFSVSSRGVPALICAPFTLHHASLADLASGHSLIEALRAQDLGRLFLTEWRSATPSMRFLGIDDYLADLNVAIDEIGSRIDLIGICQGGWLALLYAARFPNRVRKLVLAGAPIDLATSDSAVSSLAKTTPLSTFADLVELGEGRVMGSLALDLLGGRNLSDEAVRAALQLDRTDQSQPANAIVRFRDWNTRTVDLPGAYYLEVVERLFQGNQLAEGQFAALGKTIDLNAVKTPIFVLAASEDEVVPPAQLVGVERLVGTPRHNIKRAIVHGTHLSLFMGKQTLRTAWPRIARWLRPGSRKPG